MRVLRPDAFARRGAQVRTQGLRPGILFLLVFVSGALLLLSRMQNGQIAELRLHIAELLAPALRAAIVPLEPVRRLGQWVGDQFELHAELDRLRAENLRLKGEEWRAQESERKVTQLGRLVGAVEETGIEHVSARVVATSSGPFVRSALLGIGRDRDLKAGYPVIDPSGLAGRIVEVGASASRILLVTDINSRIPVLVGKSGGAAILLGDNGPTPRIGHLSTDAAIEAGDEIYTSGVGGVLPRGLRIGRVIEVQGKPRVRLYAQLDDLDYVSILKFESPIIEFRDGERQPRGREAPPRTRASGAVR